MNLLSRHRRRGLALLSALGVTSAVVLSGMSILPAGSAQAAAGCDVTYTTSSWQGGFTSNITIKNLGDAISSWTLAFNFPSAGQKVGTAWSATVAQSGTAVTARNLSYNGSLATGASTGIGFNGTWTDSNPTPPTFTLNGTVCSGSTIVPTPSPTATSTPTTPVATTPVGINGQLHVCGVNLCNQYNRAIQLRGVSTHGLQWFAPCYNTASLNALAQDWTADLLRISMYVQEDGYETDPAGFTNQVNALVDQAEARDLYALVDFHTLTPGDPNYNLARAKTFFASVAARNAAKKNVMYEIANEPNGVSWAAIKSYAEQVIPVIRAADPDAVILIGTRGWSSLGVSDGSSETEIVNNPVNATNIMYTFHFYAASHKDNYRAALSRAAAVLPMFVSEFGTVSASGDGAVDTASTTAWLDLLDRLKISYANWTYSDAPEGSAAFKAGTCSGGTYTGTGVLNPSGVLVRSRINTPDNFPTS